MSADALKEKIAEDEGLILSTDTLRSSDLLHSAYLLIFDYDLDPDFLVELDEIFEGTDIHSFLPDELEERINLGDLSEKASWLWNEEIFSYFNDIAPDGYHFSSSEGDGALFGFFKIEPEY